MATSYLLLMLSLMTGLAGNSDLTSVVPTADYWQKQNVNVSFDAMVAELKTESLSPARQAQLQADIEQLGDPAPPIRQKATADLQSAGRSALPLLQSVDSDQLPAIVQSAKGIAQEIRKTDRPQRLRRLMAIRALGELKASRAVPVLQPISESADPFEAPAARTAIAAITGKAAAPTPIAADLRAADINALPANCAAIVQYDLNAAALAPSTRPATLPASSPPVPTVGPGTPNRNTANVTNSFLPLFDAIGPARIDLITVGLADNIGPQAGFIVAEIRGTFDTNAIATYWTEHQSPFDNADDFPRYRMGPTAFAVILDPNRILFVSAPSPQAFPINDFRDLFKNGSTAITKNADMQKLLARADRAAPLFGVVKVTDAYRQIPLLPALDDIILTGRSENGRLLLHAVGTGADANSIANAASAALILRNFVVDSLTQQRAHGMPPQLADVVTDTLQSLSITSADKTLSATIAIDQSRLVGMAPFMGISSTVTARPRPMLR